MLVHLEYLPALAAGEAVRVPALVCPGPLGEHGHLPRLHPSPAPCAGPGRGWLEARGEPLIVFPPMGHNWQQLHGRRDHWGRVLVLVPELANSALTRDVPLDIVNIRAHSANKRKNISMSCSMQIFPPVNLPRRQLMTLLRLNIVERKLLL